MIAALRGRIERAHTEVGELAQQGVGRRWRMNIPAQPGRDSDLILTDGLDAGEEALTRAEQAEAERDELRAAAQRVRELHQVVTRRTANGFDAEFCEHCTDGIIHTTGPCETLQALDGTLPVPPAAPEPVRPLAVFDAHEQESYRPTEEFQAWAEAECLDLDAVHRLEVYPGKVIAYVRASDEEGEYDAVAYEMPIKTLPPGVEAQ